MDEMEKLNDTSEEKLHTMTKWRFTATTCEKQASEALNFKSYNFMWQHNGHKLHSWKPGFLALKLFIITTELHNLLAQ